MLFGIDKYCVLINKYNIYISKLEQSIHEHKVKNYYWMVLDWSKLINKKIKTYMYYNV